MKKACMFSGIGESELRAKQSEEVAVWREKLKEKNRILEKYKSEHGKLEAFFRVVREEISASSPPTTKPRRWSNHKSQSHCEAVLHISDGHYGACQDADEIEGFNAFSPEICRARQAEYMRRAIKWIYAKRLYYNINNVSVLVTGDLISGDIHQELKTTNQLPAPVQAVHAGQILSSQISMLSPHFDRVTVHFVVEDNHARLTKKPQAKEAGKNSLNYVVGEVARAYLKEHKGVEFNIYQMYEKVVRVLNRQYLISHGHNVRGWMGVPWYGIERKVAREAVARLNVIMEDRARAKDVGFHKYVFGHWHTPVDMPLYSGAGAVSGTDAYDHKCGRYARPSQPAWIVHPKHGEFDRTNFYME